MADDRDDPHIYLFEPEKRGILPLDNLHISRSLKKFMGRNDFRLRFNHDFTALIGLCRQATSDRPHTWINQTIEQLYIDLHAQGYAHSLEVWAGDELVGGLYGVAIGGAFFGESMVSRRTNASKVALIALVAELKKCGFELLDTQFLTAHLQSLGAVEISRKAYQIRLQAALKLTPARLFSTEVPAYGWAGSCPDRASSVRTVSGT